MDAGSIMMDSLIVSGGKGLYSVIRHPLDFGKRHPRIMLGGIALTGAVLAATVSGRAVVVRQSNATADGASSCPGYSASNVQTTGTGLTADLALAGPACNSYGEDIQNLKLTVNYDTGELSSLSSNGISSH